jgi:hypothetical protein
MSANETSPQMSHASAVLQRAGVRLMQIDGQPVIGIWSDRDGPHVRHALAVFGNERLPVRYLDGKNVPLRYKLRKVRGEPVPLAILAVIEQRTAWHEEPWKVRDRMLKEMRLTVDTIPPVPGRTPKRPTGDPHEP